MAYNWTTEWPGVYAHHASDCPLRGGGDCTCGQVLYRASAKSPDDRSRVLSPEFATAIEARDWLREQRARLTAATAVADEGPSVRTVIQEFLGAVAQDQAQDRARPGGTQERLRQVADGLAYVEAELGGRRIQLVRPRHVQALVDRLDAAGMPVDRIVAVIDTLRALFDYAIERDLVDFSPIVQLNLRGQQPLPEPEPQTVDDYISRF